MDPFEDANYIAACEARDSGDLRRARECFERAAEDGNVVALGELCGVCDQLGDVEAVRTHAAKLQSLGLMSAEASYIAAKFFETLPKTFGFESASELRIKYLLNAAEIGNPIAQLEVASNYWLGHNGFAQSPDKARHWVRLAKREMDLPDWAAGILGHDA